MRAGAAGVALGAAALLIALAFGLVFTVAVLLGGRSLYSAMGGTGAALDAALTYSHWVFGGAILVWLFNSLSAILRGTGARGLRAILEEVLLDVQYDLPSRDDIRRCVVTADVVSSGVNPTLVPRDRETPERTRRERSA